MNACWFASEAKAEKIMIAGRKICTLDNVKSFRVAENITFLPKHTDTQKLLSQ